MLPDLLKPRLIPKPTALNIGAETLGRILRILILPDEGVVVHGEFREAFLLHRIHDRLRAELGPLGLFDNGVFLVHLFSQLRIGLYELYDFVSLSLAIGRLCNIRDGLPDSSPRRRFPSRAVVCPAPEPPSISAGFRTSG